MINNAMSRELAMPIDSNGRRIEFGRPDALSPKHIEQFWGPWSISLDYAEQFLSLLPHANWATHTAEQRSLDTDFETTEDGIAIIEVQGMMTKRGSSFSGNHGTIELRRQISKASATDQVSAIMLSIESPGGTAAGTKELADAVAHAATQKPVLAYIEDLGASAAFYVASQASAVWANKPALVGSIGTFMVVTDSSKMAEELGITVHVIRAGSFKGVTTPGTELKEEHVAHFQDLIDQINEDFLTAVQVGRRMSKDALAAVANGKVFLATDAVANGLIDRIGTFDQAMEELTNMAEQKSGPKGATLKELQSALVGADSDFLLEQLTADATLQEAQEAWIVEQNDRLASAQKAVDEAKVEAENQAKAASQSTGVDPVGEKMSSGGVETSATDEWNQQINKMVAGGSNRHKAVLAVNKRYPGLRERMLAETQSV